jgi:hypothetical protein
LDPVGPVRERHSSEEVGSEIAKMRMSTDTGVATAAGGDKRQHDVVARHDSLDCGADFLNDSGAFVSTDHRLQADKDAGVDMVVRMTEPRRCEFDSYFIRPRITQFDLFD